MPVDLEHFVRPIVDDGVPRGCAPIARHEHAALELERENRRRLRRKESRRRGHVSRRWHGRSLLQQTVPSQERRKIGRRA
jgi:hypothetical protein